MVALLGSTANADAQNRIQRRAAELHTLEMTDRGAFIEDDGSITMYGRTVPRNCEDGDVMWQLDIDMMTNLETISEPYGVHLSPLVDVNAITNWGDRINWDEMTGEYLCLPMGTQIVSFELSAKSGIYTGEWVELITWQTIDITSDMLGEVGDYGRIDANRSYTLAPVSSADSWYDRDLTGLSHPSLNISLHARRIGTAYHSSYSQRHRGGQGAYPPRN